MSSRFSTCLFRLNHQGHDRCIGRNHEILSQSRVSDQVPEHQMRDTDNSGLRRPDYNRTPKHPREHFFSSRIQFVFEHRFVGLIQQRIVKTRHHKQRHQVFKHRPAPGYQYGRSARIGKLPAQGKPAVLRKFSLRNAEENRKPRFRSEQIIKSVVASVIGYIITDR